MSKLLSINAAYGPCFFKTDNLITSSHHTITDRGAIQRPVTPSQHNSGEPMELNGGS